VGLRLPQPPRAGEPGPSDPGSEWCSASPLSFDSDDADIDADCIPTLPVLLLEVDGEALAFASQPLLSELVRLADAFYAG
jgi:hypothetical protein